MSTSLVSAPEKTERTTPQGLTSPALLLALYWLIRDTFRQAMASRIFWIMLAVSALCIIFCLGVTVESGLGAKMPEDTSLFTKDNQPFTGTNAKSGSISLLYGFIHVQHMRDVANGVCFLQLMLSGLVVGMLGFVLALIWTAGFVPDFLQPGAAAVLLAKPLPRGALLVGKYVGVLLFVAFQLVVFFVGTWLALGLRTGIWDSGYLAAAPLFLMEFAVIYSFTVLIAVLTRSTVACIFGSVLFWLMCWGMNVGRHFTVGFEHLAGSSARLGAASRTLVEIGYWVLPKPADIFMMLEEALGASTHSVTLLQQAEIQAAFNSGQYAMELSVLSSLAFAIVLLFVSARQLSQTDY